MSGFSEVTLSQKLLELNHTQPSIQGLSLWLLHHRKHYQSIVKVTRKTLSHSCLGFIINSLTCLGLVQRAWKCEDRQEASVPVPGQ